jgi:hypothetical protein
MLFGLIVIGEDFGSMQQNPKRRRTVNRKGASDRKITLEGRIDSIAGVLQGLLDDGAVTRFYDN